MKKNVVLILALVMLTGCLTNGVKKESDPMALASQVGAVELDADSSGGVDINRGGHNATTASGARTNLGLAIGSDISAFAAQISAGEIAAGTETAIRTQSPADTVALIDAHAPGGSGFINTSGTPEALDFGRFTDSNTQEGRSYSEVRTDLGLVIGSNVQAYSANLDTYAGIAPSADGQTLLASADANEFTTVDEAKLDDVEALADVTDATNVNASGATMNADTDISSNGWFLDEDDLSSDDDTKAASQQSVKKYIDDNLTSGSIGISGTPVQYDIGEFTDGNTQRGRSYTEHKADVGLGATDDVTFGSVSVTSTPTPTITFNDSDAAGGDAADEELGKIVGNMATTTEDAEDGVVDHYAHVAGTSTAFFQIDGVNSIIDFFFPAVLTHATPKITLDDSGGADGYIDLNAADANDGVMTLGVDDSGGDDQPYIELDGVNERVEIKNELVLEGDLTRGSATLNEAELEILDGATVTTTILNNTSGTNTGDAPADDTAYNATSWDSNTDSATKNAIRDKIETMGGGVSAATMGIALVADHDDFADAVSDIGATETTLRIIANNAITEDIVVPATLKLEFVESGDLDPGTFSIRSATYKWTQSANQLEIAFTSGSEEPSIDDTMVGDASGAEAGILGVAVSSGAWNDGDAAGTLFLEEQTGTFESENLDISGGTSSVMAIGGDTTTIGTYYLELAAGGDPSITERFVVYENDVRVLPSALGRLGVSNWGYGDDDSLGYNTIYIRLSDSTDPDSKAADYVEAGYKVTIASPFTHSPEQVFDGIGTVLLTGNVDRVLPEWWGANYADSVEDSYPIQQALDSAGQFNGEVVFGAGRYYAKELLFPNRITVRGINKDQSILKLPDGANTEIGYGEDYYTNSYYGVGRIQMYSLQFDGNRDNNTTGNCYIGTHLWSRFEDCLFGYAEQSGFIHSAWSRDGANTLSTQPETFWTRCRFLINGDYGLYSNSTPFGKAADCYVTDCMFFQNAQDTQAAYSLYVGRAAGWKITGNQEYASGGSCFFIGAPSETYVTNNHIDIDGTITGSGETAYGIAVNMATAWAGDLIITSNGIRANEFSGNASANIRGISLLGHSGETSKNIIISNNVFRGHPTTANTTAMNWDTVGTLLGRAQSNSFYDWDDNGNLPNALGAFALVKRATTDQTISTGTFTTVEWNAEQYDNGEWHDNSTNNSRLTVPAYVNRVVVTASIYWEVNAVGKRALTLNKNGAGLFGLQNATGTNASVAGATNNTATSAPIDVNPGDYFEVQAYQTSTGDLDVVRGASWFSIEAVD